MVTSKLGSGGKERRIRAGKKGHQNERQKIRDMEEPEISETQEKEDWGRKKAGQARRGALEGTNESKLNPKEEQVKS